MACAPGVPRSFRRGPRLFEVPPVTVRFPRARLRLEPLADRCLPATFTVTNLLDGGPGLSH
jgi:hypothetical protein